MSGVFTTARRQRGKHETDFLLNLPVSGFFGYNSRVMMDVIHEREGAEARAPAESRRARPHDSGAPSRNNNGSGKAMILPLLESFALAFCLMFAGTALLFGDSHAFLEGDLHTIYARGIENAGRNALIPLLCALCLTYGLTFVPLRDKAIDAYLAYRKGLRMLAGRFTCFAGFYALTASFFHHIDFQFAYYFNSLLYLLLVLYVARHVSGRAKKRKHGAE